MKKIHLLFALISFVMLQSCNTTTPEQYFDRTTLNTNTVMSFGKTDFIGFLNFDKDGKQMNTNSCVTHIKNKLTFLETDIQKVKDLEPTEETKAMIDASLALFTKVEGIYKNEYMALAKRIDDGASKEEIMQAIANLETMYNPELSQKYEDLKEIAIPYAQKHGIAVKFY